MLFTTYLLKLYYSIILVDYNSFLCVGTYLFGSPQTVGIPKTSYVFPSICLSGRKL